MYENTCIPGKKYTVFTDTETYTFSQLTNRKPSETDTDSELILSPYLSHTHTRTYLPDNFSHCSQTPNGRELRGFRDDFRHSLQTRHLKDALEDGGLPKCMFV